MVGCYWMEPLARSLALGFATCPHKEKNDTKNLFMVSVQNRKQSHTQYVCFPHRSVKIYRKGGTKARK